jgi:cyanobactin maturation PatA/PatG family protease
MAASEVTGELLSRLPGLERLWSLTKGSPAICVAVLDGPIDRSAVAPASVDEKGAKAHGTHVYSVIAGSSDGLIPGIAPGCRTVVIPIFDKETGSGRYVCSQQDLAAGIRAALAEDAHIINISASQQSDLLSLSTDLSAALEDALARDRLVVAATGNQGCACDTIPASVPGVLAVGGHDDNGTPLLVSNWGPNQRAQGITAPGKDIAGACVGGGLCRASGTSFAAATVSGVAALLMSADAERGIKPSGERTKKILLSSCARPPNDTLEIASVHLAGRLDVSHAVDLLLASTTTSKIGEDTLTISSSCQTDTFRQDSVLPEGALPEPSESLPAEPVPQEGLSPADCGCGCGGGSEGSCTCGGAGKPTQFVYAIGRLGVSFISQTRRDSIWRLVNGKQEGDLKPITDDALRELFKKQPYQAQTVVWMLSRTEVPIYAIVPGGAFAAETYAFLVSEWADSHVEFISLPGVLAGTVTLYDGQVLDAVIPDLRGMYSWQTKKYVEALTDARKKAAPGVSPEQIKTQIDRFLGKIYFSIRNRGLSPAERALNAAATNAFNFSPVIVEAGREGLSLKDIGVERSPLNRPGSDYYDVLLTFFDPNDRLGHAPLRARFTIDVADTVPVMIGEPTTWYEY